MTTKFPSRYKKIHIIGFPKCGSTSLRTYLQKRYPRVEVTSFPGSSLYHPDWKITCSGKCSQPDTLSIIITRDPIERLWSAYWWSQKWNVHEEEQPTLQEFLHWKPVPVENTKFPSGSWRYLSSGLVDPIDCCDYEKYMKKAYRYNPIIIRFEDMIKNPNFPNEAKTSDVLQSPLKINSHIKLKPDKIDDYHRKLIIEELAKAGIPDHN